MFKKHKSPNMLDTSNNNCNPNNLPLGDLKVILDGEDGIRRHVPALDTHWLTRDKPFQTYICMLSSFRSFKSGAALEEWQYNAAIYQQDLEFLLGLSHHEFWSYMVYEESAIGAIATFLQRANPYYRPALSSNSSISSETGVMGKAETLYTELLNLTLRVIMRLLTTEESPTEWIEKKQHGTLLYSNFLISVPLLFDLIIAVGDGDAHNLSVLEKIFSKVLCIEHNYLNDLKEGLAFFDVAFVSMQIQVENEGCEGAGGGSLLETDAETPYDDVVLFALDCAYTLRLLLKLCPELSAASEQVKLVQSISNFYDVTVPMLYRNICSVNAQADSLKWLNEARQQFLMAARSVINSHLQGALLEPHSSNAQKYVELLQECLSAQTFVLDYQRQYPIELDVELLVHCCSNLKDYKVDFVLAGYQKALTTCTTNVMAEELSGSACESSAESDDDSRVTSLLPADSTQTKSVAIRDLDLEVSAVLDMLPDLGTGFIRRVLLRYDDKEQAIAAILDENLPPDLAKSDHNELYVPADPQDQFQAQTGINHFNVHDGDKYDVLTQDEPQCIIKKGKGLPGMAHNAEQMLDDKKHINELKEWYLKYALVEETFNQETDYNDEYDDSYEAIIEGQAQPLRINNLKKNQVAGKNSNSVYEQADQDNDGSSESEGSTTTNRNTRRDFCENPEIARERYAARQRAKRGERGPPMSAPPRDVVGAPKGQGQSKDTQRNRGHKEAHKSSRANHNRKAGAAFKRSKGMMS